MSDFQLVLLFMAGFAVGVGTVHFALWPLTKKLREAAVAAYDFGCNQSISNAHNEMKRKRLYKAFRELGWPA